MSRDHENLRERLRALENIILSSGRGATFGAPMSGQFHHSPTDLSTQGLWTSVHGDPATESSPAHTVDGMGSIPPQEKENLSFFGPSSNITFTRTITRAIAWANHVPRGGAHGDTNSLGLGVLDAVNSPQATMSQPDRQGSTSFDPFALPNEHRTGQLIDQYFTDMGQLFPILHKSAFLDDWTRLKVSGPLVMRRSWLGLLNIVLAIANVTLANSDDLSGAYVIEAQRHYGRAMRLCDSSVLNGTSLEVVQFLVLVVLYLQGTHNSIQTSNALSFAVNAAIRIGLHSPQATQAFPLLERELRNRTWYLCIVFDRTLSMTLGRPALIPSSYVRVDRIQDLEGLRENTSDCSARVFSATLDLYQILWKIIDQQYGQNCGLNTPPAVVDIVTPLVPIGNDLRSWARGLPASLMPVRESQMHNILTSYDLNDPGSSTLRYKVVLTLRSLNATILLHRRVLEKYLEVNSTPSYDAEEIDLLRRLGRDSIDVLFNSSIELINIVKLLIEAGGPIRRLLNAWWFTLYYTFNAGLVIAGIAFASHAATIRIPSAPPMSECKEGIQNAVKVFDSLSGSNNVIERCHDYMHYLLRAIETLSARSEDGAVDNSGGISISGSQILDSVPELNFADMTWHDPWAQGRNVGDLITDGDLSFMNTLFNSNEEVSASHTSDFFTRTA
ncbi:hypothetical protein PV10_06570 [Exophiala mesophila]|uniref:Xylanolytic transcriptional activator regulatory domain-containing protein n=1 Tax=Exophiala mesophila TaxID=212818 RepID=A0A0D1ZDV5_EXOME|nr:uncharacterized protein PV10_06570 [Exophiala mesophila]KIV92104.1 hypothetical protein PV10_06570 [Exophiala mesophila]